MYQRAPRFCFAFLGHCADRLACFSDNHACTDQLGLFQAYRDPYNYCGKSIHRVAELRSHSVEPMSRLQILKHAKSEVGFGVSLFFIA